MAQPSLDELTDAAAASDEPGFPPARLPKPGGVDPLGLRQINFDLMDELLPGLNNVARHIRPFVVIAWAWRRAIRLAEASGKKRMAPDLLHDFVDRIEVIFVWSLLLDNPKVDLPGRRVMSGLMNMPEWKFGGTAWNQRRKTRKNSTALSAPINYGPGLKMLGWVQRHPIYPDILNPTDAATPALDAFEARMEPHLGHPAFSEFGAVTVTANDAGEWAKSWSLDDLTEAESKVMAGMLFGAEASEFRKLTVQMICKAAGNASTIDADQLRTMMAGPPAKFVPPKHLEKTWQDFRRLQMRQLFRLALEALFWWTLGDLESRPKEIEAIVHDFLKQLPGGARQRTAGTWLNSMLPFDTGPSELISRIQFAMSNLASNDLASAICAAIALCLSEKVDDKTRYERHDRLPLLRAWHETEVRKSGPVHEYLRHVFESWVLAQHVYWSVGRGLADARARGKTLLRLRVVLEEGGWTLAPGASRGNPPVATADRLHTVISLGQESSVFGSS
jgi:hypothetical protein